MLNRQEKVDKEDRQKKLIQERLIRQEKKFGSKSSKSKS
jgi:hypothetical protein